MKKLKKIFEKKELMEAQFKPSMPTSPFGVPEEVYSKLQEIYLALTGSSYPAKIVTDNNIQELLVVIENYIGITSSFSIGAFSIPEDVRDRLRTLYQTICGTSYPQCSAIPEDLYEILKNILFASSIYGHWKFNEGAGLTAFDSSWRSHHGTLKNMGPADWIVGKVGPFSLTFSMLVPKYIELSDCAGFERDNPFSVECWFKTSEVGGPHHLVAKMENAGDYKGWALRTNVGTIEFILSSKFGPPGQSIIRIRTINAFNDGSWHHLVVTYDGSSSASGVTIYLDGASEALITVVNNLISTILNAVSLNFAARVGGAYGYTGDLDEIVIWTKTLSQSEVLFRYNSGNGREDFKIN